MKQDISTLMDGELCGDDAEILLAKIRFDREAHQGWSTYHLIGDALRQPDYVPSDLSANFFERLKAEPTVLAPQVKRNNKTNFVAMSAVASFLAIAFLAWFSVQLDHEPAVQQVAQTNYSLRNVNLTANDGMNDYLLAHHEFSPSTDVRGAASYIRTVALGQTGVGR